MNVAVYIKGEKIELFKDEEIVMNLNVKNLSDISKIISDFTQGSHSPASPINNKIFTYWFNADVDGTFNANVRVDAYIEINSLEYKYGTIQLDSCLMKNGIISSYEWTFYAKGVNLNDTFGDDTLRSKTLGVSNLDFSAYNHNYNSGIVLAAISGRTIANGELYYPLINSITDMSIGNAQDSTNLLSITNTLSYLDLKPAIRLIHVIEAIELYYDVVFSRDFFDRAVFYNLFLWLSSDEGRMKAYGDNLQIDIPTDQNQYGFVFSAANDNITWFNAAKNDWRVLMIKVVPEAEFGTVPYKITAYNNGDIYSEVEGFGKGNAAIEASGNNISYFSISSAESFSFTTELHGKEHDNNELIGYDTNHTYLNTPIQSIDAKVVVSEQMPDLKIKDLFSSLISQFNLIIKDNGDDDNKFTVDTLENWYSRGRTYDITNIVDISDYTIKKPDIKKQIDFKYQETDTILGTYYRDANDVGYGDLKQKWDINGDELEVETDFENLMFERLQNETTGDLSDIQVGYTVDKKLEPVKTEPIMFYRNGYVSTPSLTIQPGTFVKSFHTATEDNLRNSQITNSLNFGSDNSTYFPFPIDKSLYFNFWKNYVEDIYNPKTRVLNIKCKFPSYLLHNLELNDKFIISQNKYKIATAKINLIDGKGEIELFTDYSLQLDSVTDIIPVTVDRTDITVDSDQYTVDMTVLQDSTTSYITNSISIVEYQATKAQEHFELKVEANTYWVALNVDTGFGVDWYRANIIYGTKSQYLRITVDENTGAYRSGKINFTFGSTVLTLTISQS